MTNKKVEGVLRTVLDPELGINIVDLGLVYEVKSETDELTGERIKIIMTLTTPGCPLGGWFVEQVKEAVSTGLGIEMDKVMVEITFDPPWTQEMMSDEAKDQLGF